jgi:nitrite reductase/ring-hydroxylating ferredoxin subunit
MADGTRVYVIASEADFPANTHRVVEVGSRKIGVFNLEGKFYALPNLCPHQLGPLATGKVSGTLTARQANDYRLEWAMEGEVVTCPWHGLEYHIPSGQCLAYSEIKLRTYPVWIEDGLVKIRL